MCFVGQPFWKSSDRASVPDRRPLTKASAGTDSGRVDGADRAAQEGQARRAPREGRAGRPGRTGQDLPPAGLRWDALAGEWVIIAAQRQDRTFLPPPGECPLDPSRPGRLTEIPVPDYDVVVFENRFPSLRGLPPSPSQRPAPADGPPDAAPPPDGPPETGGVPGRPPTGRCEVVCFTSDHDASFASLPPRRVRTVLEAWADRTTVLSSTPGIEQVYCFENRGEEIGVTLHHPHGQIYGFPFVTPHTTRMLDQAKAYAAAGRRNLFDVMVAGEQAAGTRIVARNEHWTAFVPAAARWPYEILLFPARRVPNIPALGEAARGAFCDIYPDLLRRFDALFGMPLPYIAAWHQAPAGDEFARREFGLHLQVMSIRRAPGKLKYLAGTESGMGVWINDITPEEAALRLREAR
jgi:UDPglucose--hexose-1-phosphate uridylyltransferase